MVDSANCCLGLLWEGGVGVVGRGVGGVGVLVVVLLGTGVCAEGLGDRLGELKDDLGSGAGGARGRTGWDGKVDGGLVWLDDLRFDDAWLQGARLGHDAAC